MPYLPTDRARRDGALSPADSDHPLVLTRRTGSSLVVAESCPRARQLGLRAGLSLGEAQASALHLLVLPYEPYHDHALLQRLADWALRFSPVVEPAEPHTLLLDITGCQRLFGTERNIARQAITGLAEQGLYARAAVADTIGTAVALATVGEQAIVVVPAGQTRTYLAPLPPAALRIDAPTCERLETLGIRTIGTLFELPRPTLPARFGSQLILRLQQALGEVFEGLTARQPEEIARASVAFDGVLHDLPMIQSVADRLLGRVFEQLVQRDLALRRLDGVLYYERCPPALISIRLAQASRARRHVAELLSRRLETVDLSPGVTGVALVARETSRWKPAQSDLFEARSCGDDEALAGFIDRITNRVGPAAVARPRLVDDHQPECAFRYVPLAETGRSAADEGAARRGTDSCSPLTAEEKHGSGARAGPDAENTPPQAMSRPPRPVQLLPRPVPIRVIALVPDGPPTWFCYRGREHVVVRAWGPERLETGWWRGPDVRRDYFRVTSQTGEQFWLFCLLPERRWYVHGSFT